ncbi:MAG: serine/threonine-protein phosphatase [Actinobacteria bacterium]|nr:serine/threonine-protein phosphatase [Actinomycetota bacterium]
MGTGEVGPGGEDERLWAFGELAQALAHAASVEEAARAITAHVPRALGASFANLALVEPDTDELRIANPSGLDPEVAARYRTLPRDASTPLTDAVRTAATVLLRSPADNAARYPHLSAEADALGLLALAAVPIHAGGDVCGALGVGWTEPFVDAELLHGRLEWVADLVSGAVERARTADARAALVAALQAFVLPDVTSWPGLEVAARYQPAGRGLGFGGDWYDLIELDEHRTAVVVGDVVGHGIEAAARMVQVRSALHAVVRLGVALDEVLARAAPVIGADDQLIGTAVVAVVDRAAGTVRHVSAGHPPMVVVDPEGRPWLLDGAPSVVLGLTPSPGAAASVPFPPGSVLLAYTDGLVESRTGDIEAGIDRVVRDLVGALGGAGATSGPRPIDEVADAVLAGAGAAADLDDDVALLVLRHHG